MILAFKTRGCEDIFNGINSREARRTCPENLWRVAARKLDQLDSVQSSSDLRIPPGDRLEELFGDRRGQHSIRINDQYRICFIWTDTSPDQVENDLVNGRRSMTSSSALRLARYFGTSPSFWMNLQLRWDLYFAQQEETQVLESIQPYQPSSVA